MELGKVKGQVIATARDPNLPTCSLLLVELCAPNGAPVGPVQIAADPIGAGEGELVLLTRGSSARLGVGVSTPVDLCIVGIVDEVACGGKAVYVK